MLMIIFVNVNDNVFLNNEVLIVLFTNKSVAKASMVARADETLLHM
jgi:hypothetical protein